MEDVMSYETPQGPASPSTTRRGFFENVGTVTAATVAGSVLGWNPLAASEDTEREAQSATAPSSPEARRAEAFRVRVAAARSQHDLGLPAHPNNGDEARYGNQIGSYSKGLPHDSRGEVDLLAYRSLLHALETGNGEDFERIVLGVGDHQLTNPQAGLGFTMEGGDAHAFFQQPAPAFASAEEAGEIVENYWMALARDIPFSDYDTHPLTLAAAADLSRMADFRGPKAGGRVTPQTLFRGTTPDDLVGPYLSQFMLLPTSFGAEVIGRRMRTPVAGDDYLTDYAEWLAIQNGALPPGPNQFDSTRRYLRNGRDLGEWVHIDVLFQAYFNALLILFGLGAPLNPSNPYRDSRTQIGFGTFGPPFMASLLCGVAREVLKAVWFQKWFVHRRLRPEAFAGRIHNHLTGVNHYPIHQDALNSSAADAVFAANGTYLLPMAYPEGCPTHPAYGGGHATVAGASVTVLKALFDESFAIPDPVEASVDGLSHVPFVGPPLTLGGELNKLASNVAQGRNIAGVHWRSDAVESLKLGEEVAIRYLRDERRTFHEDFRGFSLRRFDGTPIVI
jgi:hypothetical protein